MKVKAIKIIVCLFIFLLAFAELAKAEIYGYIDKDGVCHFSNKKLDGRYRKVRMWSGIGSSPEFDKGKYDSMIRAASLKYAVDFYLVKAVIKSESNFNRKAVSRAGAKGLMQLMPQTALLLKVKNPFDPAQNIDGGVRYLREQLDNHNGNVILALAAYNAGPNAVAKYKGVPPYKETKNYIKIVIRNYKRYKKLNPPTK